MVEVNKYTNGKIYTIRCHNYDKYYIGSTVETLSQRLATHKRDYKRYINNKRRYVSSFKLIEMGDYYIELLETYSCLTRDELHKREGQLQRQFRSEIVNICVAGRTPQEYRVDNNTQLKQKYQDNKEQILQKQKQYDATHKEQKAQYYSNNKEIIAENNKQYRHDNKKVVAEKAKKTYICDCGKTLTICHKSTHEKTQKHQSFITNQFYINELNI